MIRVVGDFERSGWPGYGLTERSGLDYSSRIVNNCFPSGKECAGASRSLGTGEERAGGVYTGSE